jgi:hypothetical protein
MCILRDLRPFRGLDKLFHSQVPFSQSRGLEFVASLLLKCVIPKLGVFQPSEGSREHLISHFVDIDPSKYHGPSQWLRIGFGRRGFMTSIFVRSANELRNCTTPIAIRSSAAWWPLLNSGAGSSFRWYLCGEVGPVRINDTDILVMKIRQSDRQQRE